MKKVVVIIIILMLFTGCSKNKVAEEYRAEYKTINKKETKKLLSEGNTVIIDVRNEKSYEKSHINDAINIPYKDIDSIINKISKDSIVVIYGSSKKESKNATNKVIDLGYSLVYDLGTIKDW